MATTIVCTRSGEERAQLGSAPFPDELGERIHGSICQVCWDEWLQRQMQLINHFALDVRTSQAREFLRRNVEAFLFEQGEGDEIDTGQFGKL